MSQTNLAFIASIVPSRRNPQLNVGDQVAVPCVWRQIFTTALEIHLTGLPKAIARYAVSASSAIDIELAAKAAADLGGDHASTVLRQIQHPGEGAAQ